MENLKFHESSAQQILPQTAAASDSHEPVKRSRSRIDSIDLLRRQKQGGGVMAVIEVDSTVEPKALAALRAQDELLIVREIELL